MDVKIFNLRMLLVASQENLQGGEKKARQSLSTCRHVFAPGGKCLCCAIECVVVVGLSMIWIVGIVGEVDVRCLGSCLRPSCKIPPH